MLLLSKNVKAAAVSCGAVRRAVCQLHHGYRHSGVGQFSQKQHAGSCPTNPAVVSGSTGRLYSTSRWVVACAAERSTVELEVKVEGMKCGGCSSRVENVLKAMDHVKGVQVDLETKLATVEVEAPNLIDAMNMLPTFVQAIKDLGFEAEPHIEYQA